MTTRNLAAVDLGADSGRVMLATFDGQRLTLREVYRFPNRPVFLRGHRFWNMFALWDEMLTGLRKAKQVAGRLDSIGVDTWGVDYGLIDAGGFLLGASFQYRDARTDGVMEQVFAHVPREKLYERTGIQLLPINTLFQLYAHEQLQPGQLAQAHRLLMIPDLLHYWLCGSMTTEYTNASTTQCLDPRTGQWVTDLLEQLDIPTAMLPPIVQAGSVLGEVVPALQNELGMPQVIAPATHDTGSAIAGIPAQADEQWGYISSGTWSLVGVELSQPLITHAGLLANCTNEGGILGTTRFLKNITGLWLLQECQRHWARHGYTPDYNTLLAAADKIPAFTALIDPDDSRFLAPENMPATIDSYLIEHGQAPLQEPAAFARCIMESLVLRSCEAFEQIGQLTNKQLKRIHVIGGGARNTRMNQWLADALSVPVIAGPYEATALGNALMQLVGLGELSNLVDVRVLAQTAPTQTFSPQTSRYFAWNEVRQRFKAGR